MGADTAIEWTHQPGFRGATWNPTIGCRRVSPGCEHCYAEVMSRRIVAMGGPAAKRYVQTVKHDAAGAPRAAWSGRFVEVREVLDLPLRTKAPTCYFVNSMSDLFGEGVSDEYIAAVFGVMAATPRHRYQILTKRAERMARWFEWIASFENEHGPPPAEVALIEAENRCVEVDRVARPWPLPNVWLGVSVEDQQRADERIPHLLRCPAAVRFLSVEPLLGPVTLDPCVLGCKGHLAETFGNPLVNWVIVGGESGPGARPCALEWIESVVAQCREAGVPVFVKQLGSFVVSEDRTAPDDVMAMFKSWQPEHADRAPSGESWAWRAGLRDRKGGDPSEWPDSLRVREFPKVPR